ncbi:MAG: aminotransferase class IV [Flavobacteriales bacterium]|nr:aminotransferase class IV [Flavobacteriales bacterium]
MDTLLYNGELRSFDGPDSAVISLGNRAFLYADGIFETIRVMQGVPLFVEAHFERMREGLKAHRIHPPLGFTPKHIKKEISRLLEATNITGSARIRMTLSRRGTGYYAPKGSDLDVVMTAEPITEADYSLNEKGLSVDIYPEMKCTPNHLTRFKNLAANIYIQSGLWAQEHQLDTALIQNDRMGIIESTSSNLFLVSNGVLYTPGLDGGATAGIMRAQIINLALASGMKVYECNLTPQNMLIADEVFLTNAVQGIQWVGSYRTKRYFNATIQSLMRDLNQRAKLELQA